ncbi:DUF3761 domain-containing protein [Streptomyces avermitilis]
MPARSRPRALSCRPELRLVGLRPERRRAHCTDGTWPDSKHFSGTCSRHRSASYWFMEQERRPGVPSGCGAPQPAAEEDGSCARDQ